MVDHTFLLLSDVDRIMDWLLYEGDIVLHRIGLSLCKLKQDQLMSVSEFTSLYEIFVTPLASLAKGGKGGHGFMAADRSRVVAAAHGSIQWGTMSRDDLYRFREEVKPKPKSEPPLVSSVTPPPPARKTK